MKPARDAGHGLRERILAEATRLFAQRGFAGTSVRELVEACECTKPALYYYFDGKDGLFREVIEQQATNIEQILRSGLEAEGPLRQRVHDMVDGFIDHAQENPDGMLLVIRMDTAPEEGSPQLDMQAHESSHFDIFSRMFQQGLDSGEVRPGADPMDCALALSGALHYQFAEAVLTSQWDRDRYHRLIDLVFEGIAP